MTFVLVQRGSWPGWSPNADIYLEPATAAAYLTAARDYQKATGRTDAGIAEPLGGLRTAAQIAEMQWAFDHRGTAQSAALYKKYNMDPASKARPITNSPHALGLCVDIASSFFLNWLIVNGARYGLKRTLVKENDLRHFQYEPGTETAALDVTSLDGGAAAPVRTTPPMTNTRLVADVTTTPPTFYWLDIGPGQTLRASHMTQAQANIAATNIGTPTNVVSSPAEVQAVQQVLAALTPSGASSIDPTALAKALAPLLDTVTEAELTAALAKIRFPTKGTVELA